jgi:hypothetical protein
MTVRSVYSSRSAAAVSFSAGMPAFCLPADFGGAARHYVTGWHRGDDG